MIQSCEKYIIQEKIHFVHLYDSQVSQFLNIRGHSLDQQPTLLPTFVFGDIGLGLVGALVLHGNMEQSRYDSDV